MGEVKASTKTLINAEADSCVLESAVDGYDSSKKELTIKVNEASGKGFRLVHDGKVVIDLFEGSDKDITGSIYEIFIGTKEECSAEIDRLGLIQNEGP